MRATHTPEALDALRAQGAYASARSWLFYVFVPILLLVCVLVADQVGGAVNYWFAESPVGVRESLTGGLALAASAVSLIAFFHPAIRRDWKLRTWLLLYALAMAFFGGEDLNWGQYYFGWEAAEFFQTHNRENETNLHNISTWFNQKPRFVVELWLFVAGILVPLGWRLPQRLTEKFVPAMLWPDTRLVFVSIMALLLKVPARFEKLEPGALGGIRWSEVQELFIAYCLLLYALLLLERVRAWRE